MADDRNEVWVVRDAEEAAPSRAVSLRKLRRGVEIGRLRLDYQVAYVGSDRWTTLAELFESLRAATVVVTESSVVTSAPNRISAAEAQRVLERAQRPRLRRIARDTALVESEPLSLVPTEDVSERELLDLELSDADLLPPSDPNPDFSPPSTGAVVLEELARAKIAESSPPAPHDSAYAPPEVATTDVAASLAASPFVVSAPREEVRLAVMPEPAEVQRSIAAAAALEPPETRSVGGMSSVVVTDIRMPFGSMVVFMVKWAFASIPALIIISVVLGAMGSFFALVLRAL